MLIKINETRLVGICLISIFLAVCSFIIRQSFATTTITTLSTATATPQPPQRKTFRDINGTYWLSYFNGTHIVYVTSSDTVTWSSPLLLGNNLNVSSGNKFSIRYYNVSGGQYFYYVYSNTSGSGNYLIFGRCDKDSITLSNCIETLIVSSTTSAWQFPDVEVAGNGSVLVSVGEQIVSLTKLNLRVYNNSNNDGMGTWTSALTSVVLVGALASDTVTSSLSRLSNGAYVTYTSSAVGWVRGKEWHEYNKWNTTVETIIGASVYTLFGTAVTFNNDIMFSYCNISDSKPNFKMRNYTLMNNVWGNWENSSTTSCSGAVHLVANQTNGDAYVIWGNSRIFYAKRFYNSTWNNTYNISTTQSNLQVTSVIPFWNVTNNTIGVVWTTGEPSTYYLKYGLIDFNIAEAPVTTTTTTTTTTIKSVCNYIEDGEIVECVGKCKNVCVWNITGSKVKVVHSDIYLRDGGFIDVGWLFHRFSNVFIWGSRI